MARLMAALSAADLAEPEVDDDVAEPAVDPARPSLQLVHPDPQFIVDDAGAADPLPATESLPYIAIEHGSENELARVLINELRRQFGDIALAKGEFYRFTGTHFEQIENAQIRRFLANTLDGIEYVVRIDKEGAPIKGKIKIGDKNSNAILRMASDILEAEHGEDFFENAPIGVNCSSGFIDLSGDVPVLRGHDPKWRQNWILPATYPCADFETRYASSLLKKYFDVSFFGDANKDEKRSILLAAIGVAMAGKGAGDEAKAVFLKGSSAGNGKSQYLNMAEEAFPPSATAALKPQDFGDNRLNTTLVKARINLVAELPEVPFNADRFKEAVTGDRVIVRELYQRAYPTRYSAQHIFAANRIVSPPGGFDNGVRRRMIVVEFDRKVPKEERIAGIGKRIAAEEMDILLTAAIQAAQPILKAGRWPEHEWMASALSRWLNDSDTVLGWLRDHTQRDEDNILSVIDAYDSYREFCKTTGVSPVGQQKFLARLEESGVRHGRTSTRRGLVGIALAASAADEATAERLFGELMLSPFEFVDSFKRRVTISMSEACEIAALDPLVHDQEKNENYFAITRALSRRYAIRAFNGCAVPASHPNYATFENGGIYISLTSSQIRAALKNVRYEGDYGAYFRALPFAHFVPSVALGPGVTGPAIFIARSHFEKMSEWEKDKVDMKEWRSEK